MNNRFLIWLSIHLCIKKKFRQFKFSGSKLVLREYIKPYIKGDVVKLYMRQPSKTCKSLTSTDFPKAYNIGPMSTPCVKL